MEFVELRRPSVKRVLIVEDDELNMKLIHDLLEVHGYTTITTPEGSAALGLARANRPHLILMDLQLPDVSGFDAVRQLKREESTRAIPVVAVTAFAMGGDARKALASGCDAYVAKPFIVRNFLALVESFIGTSSSELR
ncbi:MAG TPA: response regulator [Stellaceae bacterium]|jgi:two-component system cell cycle response regulator DivK|nr:response regulator [Stellaceae bacterium]